MPGVKLSKDAWLPYLERAATKALENASLIDIEKELGKAGFKAVEGVQRRMQAHIPPPLAASTVRNRRRRSKGSSYRRKALMPGDTTPLIDTGELIKHISWVLQKEGEDVATGTREIGA